MWEHQYKLGGLEAPRCSECGEYPEHSIHRNGEKMNIYKKAKHPINRWLVWKIVIYILLLCGMAFILSSVWEIRSNKQHIVPAQIISTDSCQDSLLPIDDLQPVLGPIYGDYPEPCFHKEIIKYIHDTVKITDTVHETPINYLIGIDTLRYRYVYRDTCNCPPKVLAQPRIFTRPFPLHRWPEHGNLWYNIYEDSL